MADVNRLKKKAAEFEAKRQYERAIAVYEQIIGDSADGPREVIAPLFNRVGDLYLRLGDQDQALILYENAVDMYSELGFFNNAIALCSKILRQAPNRAPIFYKLGKISAKKGFNSDAKQNFLEYASRMQHAGDADEAFRALKEFADLCPGQDDVRLMLAEQLARADRKTEAVEQLQILHEQLVGEDRHAEATATAERIRALDPTVEPRRSAGGVQRRTDELVFLSLEDEPAPTPAVRRSARATPPAPLSGLELTSLAEQPPGVAPPPAPPSPYGPRPTEATAEQEPPPAHARPIPTPPSTPVRPLTPQEFGELSFLPPPVHEPLPEPAAELTPLPDLEIPAEEAAEEVQPLPIVPEDVEPLPEKEEADTAALPVAPVAWSAPPRISTPAKPSRVPTPTKPPLGRTPPPAAENEMVDLAAWARSEAPPRTTRMIADAEIPPEGEQADFDEMLAKFKHGIAQHMDPEDHGAHYDLGVAFKAMGLADEAIAEFQKALPGRSHRLAAYEQLGHCFIERGQHAVAVTLLERAVREPEFTDEQGIAVLYLLGSRYEALGDHETAAGYYQRVLAVDINFRDVSNRLTAVSQAFG